MDNIPRGYQQADFEVWWNTPVFVDSDGQTLTRRDLILTVADQDGGAHVDPKLEERYAQLSRHNSMGWFYSDGITDTPIKELERAAIRQIAHEVLKTLVPGYAKSMAEPKDGFIVANMEYHAANKGIPNDRRIGRNELCPCGSGKKYKMCHGKNGPVSGGQVKSRKRHTRRT